MKVKWEMLRRSVLWGGSEMKAEEGVERKEKICTSHFGSIMIRIKPLPTRDSFVVVLQNPL